MIEKQVKQYRENLARQLEELIESGECNADTSLGDAIIALRGPAKTPYYYEVERGAKYLDEQKPNWFNLVNLDKLDMAHHGVCIIGQLFGEYWQVSDKIGETKCISYGFNVDHIKSPRYQYSEWSLLNRAWKNKIRQLRKG